jgi:hypothetical protein
MSHVLLLDVPIAQQVLVFQIYVKNMGDVIDAAIQIAKIKLNLDVCVLGTGVKSLDAKLMDVKSRALHADVASSMAHCLIVLSHAAPKVFTGINCVTAIGCCVILLQS